MHFVIDFVKFCFCGALVLWVLDWVIADAVAKGIVKARLKIDVQDQIEDGVSDALEAYFRRRSIASLAKEE